MSITIRSGALTGIAGVPVGVEVVINRGLPGYHLVGLPGTEVRESRERVLAALRHGGVRVPPGRITVNLSPAGERKSGASFDLAIAVAIAAVAEDWPARPGAAARLRALFVGELSLFGEVRPVRGLLPVLLDVAARGPRCAVVPAAQRAEAALVPGLRVVAARDLGEVLTWCRHGTLPAETTASTARAADPADAALAADAADAADEEAARAACADLGRLGGQALALKAAVVAATGRHNLLLVGPPGAGKTRLARLLADLQPPLADDALVVTRIHSAAGLLAPSALARRRPWRAPHHTVTAAGLLGGGPALRPGEMTLAHGGLLFLDELAEFPPAVLDVLRQPLQDGYVAVVRGTGQRRFPARFQLVAACNPCRCGFHGSGQRACRCPAHERARYHSRLSGPLLDRFDLFVGMGIWRGAFDGSAGPAPGADWRLDPRWEALGAARDRLAAWDLAGGAPLADGGHAFLDRARAAFGLSLRAVTRCRAVAATIAALDDAGRVEEAHLREALEFRREVALEGGA